MKRIPLWIIICFLLTVTGSILGAYIYNFNGFLISDASSDWGTFGDFIGGILNPIFAACNLLILIYITYEISDAEENRNKENADVEEKRNKNNNEFQKKLVLSELRQNALKEFTQSRTNFANELLANNLMLSQDGNVKLFALRSEMMGLIDQYEFLFDTINPDEWKEEINSAFENVEKIWKEEAGGKVLHGDLTGLSDEELQAHKALLKTMNPEKFGQAAAEVSIIMTKYLREMQEILKGGWA